MTIKSFRDRATATVFEGMRVRGLPPEIQQPAKRKLDILQSTNRLEQLLTPPANRLERLRGGRSGQYSIRINKQWRVCFRWAAPHAYDVQICDYHR